MNKRELNEIILEEKHLYVPNHFIFQKYTHQKRYIIWKYLAYYRLAQYHKGKLVSVQGNIFYKIYEKLMYRYYLRKKNIYGEKSAIEISNHCNIGRRINIWHGNVIINANLGDDCVIHGNNVLGNKGGTDMNDIPTLGNGVDIGVGAIIIGNIYIADSCRIGANAVVIRDCDVPESTLVGVPALMKG